MVLLGTDYVFDVIVPVTILNRYFLYRYGSFAGSVSNRRLIFPPEILDSAALYVFEFEKGGRCMRVLMVPVQKIRNLVFKFTGRVRRSLVTELVLAAYQNAVLEY